MKEGNNIPSDPKEVLEKFWGFSSFRSLQEEIINNTLKGKDTLALMPTGGGKSICFQVPGLIFPGLTIVISPLIALMKDQVGQLIQRGIKAKAIISGMHKHEIDIALDNCVYGHTKFLYVSPERLKSDLFIARLKNMTVSLLVIDEAHCISQWGYDFRPSYLEIADIRKHLSDEVPVLALTATATPQIQKDIIEKLNIPDAITFRKSFARANLCYKAIKTQNKLNVLLNHLSNTKDAVIIYVRSRKNTRYYSNLLEKNGYKSAYYHAGLSTQMRDKIQSDWIKNKIRIIVATNAFGMGIDKGDVRLVAHLDLPDSLEAYYQEAGRAGRDEKYSEAVIIYQDRDIEELKSKTSMRFPELKVLRQVYTGICNHFQLALGSGEMQSFNFDLEKFSKKFNTSVLSTYYSIKELEKHGFIQFEENSSSISTLNILPDNKELYSFQVANPKFDVFLKSIIRMYGGEIFSSYVKINEDQIASKTIMEHNRVIEYLKKLNDLKIIDYIPRSDLPKITFLLPRQDTHSSFITEKQLEIDRKRYFDRMRSMIHFTELINTCRSNYLQDYFGEENYSECGVCDNCLEKFQSLDKEAIKIKILNLLELHKSLNINDLYNFFYKLDHDDISGILREMTLKGDINIGENRNITR
ncbi:MAG: ATP-dependent DNA helicase RecQ [Cytophagales bacterium]